jgi:hypothetical protein
LRGHGTGCAYITIRHRAINILGSFGAQCAVMAKGVEAMDDSQKTETVVAPIPATIPTQESY